MLEAVLDQNNIGNKYWLFIGYWLFAMSVYNCLPFGSLASSYVGGGPGLTVSWVEYPGMLQNNPSLGEGMLTFATAAFPCGTAVADGDVPV